jgi:hypothetical protein
LVDWTNPQPCKGDTKSGRATGRGRFASLGALINRDAPIGRNQLELLFDLGQFPTMTVEELKSGLEHSTPEERAYLAAFLKHLSRKDDPAYRSELTTLNKEIDEGKKFTLAQVKRLDETLKSEGL